MLTALSHSSLVGLMSIVVTLLPVAAGLAYAIRPTEQRLALMRPLSLAAIFAGLSGSMTGVLSVLKTIGRNESVPAHVVAIGSAEAMVPLFVAFGCLTVAWLTVAVGLRRAP